MGPPRYGRWFINHEITPINYSCIYRKTTDKATERYRLGAPYDWYVILVGLEDIPLGDAGDPGSQSLSPLEHHRPPGSERSGLIFSGYQTKIIHDIP